MTAVHARLALTPEGWDEDVRLVAEAGRIAAVTPGAAPEPGDARADILLPGLANLHSHAFQRGMAGLAERRGPHPDSFWSWRELMYRFALRLSPDDIEAIAAQAYVEMLEAGFTRVGEFHYLHHAPDGRPYADPAEMSARVVAAAAEAGIALTLLTVLYAHSGFGARPPLPEQRRFVTDLDGFAALIDRCRAFPGLTLGLAPHSLRAVTPDQLAALPALLPGAPVHIHVAEQAREVEDCLAWSGARPVEWLLANAPVGEDWCLIHATHVTAAETGALAHTGAVVGLCPVTEANLGDGVFPGPGFLAAGGRFGVGTDSNIAVSAAAELRQLEYAQRLTHRARNVLFAGEGSTGEALFRAAARGGARALGTGTGLAPGRPADFLSLAPRHGLPLPPLDAFVFAGAMDVDSVWVSGVPVVTEGRHHHRDRIAARFTAVMRPLLAEL